MPLLTLTLYANNLKSTSQSINVELTHKNEFQNAARCATLFYSRDLNDLWLFRLLIRRRFDFSTRERFSRKANSIELSAHIKQCLRRSTERLQPVAHKWSHCNNRCNIADNNLQASLGDRFIVIFISSPMGLRSSIHNRNDNHFAHAQICWHQRIQRSYDMKWLHNSEKFVFSLSRNGKYANQLLLISSIQSLLWFIVC